jgi:hypothetical protein
MHDSCRYRYQCIIILIFVLLPQNGEETVWEHNLFVGNLSVNNLK